MVLNPYNKARTGILQVGLAAIGSVLTACSGSSSGSGTDPNFDTTRASTPPAGFAQFIYPTSGQLGVDPDRKFQWSVVPEASSYQLQVGTTPGANDVFDSGNIGTTSVSVPNLPATGTLYARVRMLKPGWSTTLPPGLFPNGTYVTFRMDSNPTGATFVSPAANSTADADTPITWLPDPLAQSYHLTIVNTADGSQLADSGQINSPLRVVSGLPAGAKVSATLVTNYVGGATATHSLSYTVGSPTTSTNGMLAVARTLAGAVRQMADADNQPYDSTPLAAATAAESDGASDCVAFSSTLLKVLSDANVPLQTRWRGICFNYPDCHELVEILDPDNQRWTTLDPTFGLYTLNSSGQPATVEEVSAAARSQAFSSLSYIYLTPAGRNYALSYYIDYPLLFLEVYQPGGTSAFEQPAPLLQPYFDSEGDAVDGQYSGFYSIECAPGSDSVNAVVDGVSDTFTCTNGFTPVTFAFTLTLQGTAAGIWSPHRFVF